ncbi:MAG: hypothetical protein O3A00_21645 [Planctomycetota bacterium]|nr:hypothetical protein [Planctomycetota bacterium]
MADEKPAPIEIKTPAGWGGETISLPPEFAPDMKVTGTEVIRFAPGMMQAKSDSFFSYVFVFRLKPEPKLTQEVLEREFLTYYRGLSKTVAGSTVDVGAEKFKLALKLVKPDKDETIPKGLTRYSGKLDWFEPFALKAPHVIHLEIDTYSQGDQNYLFVCASSKEQQPDNIWKELKKIRTDFESGHVKAR